MVAADVEAIVGAPVEFDELKVRPGRRRTLRARGPLMSVIVKVYSSERAPIVAKRLMALAAGPAEPLVPLVLLCDPEQHLIVLTDMPGSPLREAVAAADLAACRRTGRALGAWHAAWTGRAPLVLERHTAERELRILLERARSASMVVGDAVRQAAPGLASDWSSSTAVHRDLYEEQILLGERVSLIDLDDAAVGPPELDVGNLVAHLELFARKHGLRIPRQLEALLAGYADVGPDLDPLLLGRCRSLSLLRLACLNDDPRLVDVAVGHPVTA
jgi:Phosphotransferase enzyme family